MADNAIAKLFEEMREARTKIAECNAEEARLSEARNANTKALKTAMGRAEILNVTLEKHIHEGMPVVQAKMQAHDEVTQGSSSIATISASSIVGGSISVSRLVTSKIVPTKALPPRPTHPRV